MKKNIFFLFVFLQSVSAQLPVVYESSALYTEAMELFRLDQFEASAQKFEAWQDEISRGGKNNLGALYYADSEYYRALCSWYLERPDAELLLRNYIRLYPVHAGIPMARIWLARNTFRNKLYRETLKELSPLTIPDAWLPDSVNHEVRYMAGICYYQFREYAKALPHFSALVNENSPYQTEARMYAGVIHFESGNYHSAIRVLNLLDEITHTRESVLAKARSLFETHALDSLIQFTRNLPPNLKDPELYLTLAAAAIRMEKYADAILWFDTYLESRTLLNTHLKYQYAYALYREDKHNLAIPLFEQLAGVQDSLASLSAYYLAYCFLKEGKTETARLAFMRASSEKVQSSITEDAIIQYAKISYQEKYFDDALNQLRIYLKKYPKGIYINEARALIGEVLFYARNYKESVSYFESAKISDERSLSAYQRSCYFYGLELYSRKAYKEADIYFRKGFNLAHDPQVSAGCRYWHAESLFRQGYYEESVRQYDAFLELPVQARPDYYTEAWYGKGWALLKQKNALDAAEAFIRFLNQTDKSRKPDLYLDALLRTGDCEFSLKNYKEALRYFQEATGKINNNPDYAFWRIAQIQYRMEDYAEVINTTKKIIQQFKNSEFRDDALDLAAETSLKWLIDYKSASQFSRTLVQEHALSEYVPAAWNRMGIAAYNSNDKPAAEKFFRKVLMEYCQDTMVARSALQNLNFIVNADVYVEIFTEYRQKCPEVNEGLESISWEAAWDKFNSDAWPEAISLLNLYLKDFPSGNYRTQAYFYRGLSYEKTGKSTLAVKDFQEVTKGKVRNDYMYIAHLKTGKILMTVKDWKGAADAFAQARETTDNTNEKFEAGIEECQALENTRAFTEAQQLIDKLMTIPGLSLSQKHQLQYKTAIVYLSRNDSTMALNTFKELETEAHAGLAGAKASFQILSIYAGKMQIEAAEETGLMLKDVYPGYKEWVIKGYLVLAEMYFKSGDLFQAEALLEYILSQPEDYYPGMREEALAKQTLMKKPTQNQETEEITPGRKNK